MESNPFPINLEHLKNKNPTIRMLAVEAVSMDRKLLNKKEILNLLAGMLKNDKSPAVRKTVANALGKSGNSNVIKKLMRAKSSDPSKEVRRAAVKAIGEIEIQQSLFSYKKDVRRISMRPKNRKKRNLPKPKHLRK